ncbi:nucleosome assembly protein 1;2-like isoform X1 [Rosa rugosa]|uniref:nucleosome assembly protein 1;2-like isoform X1 n=1 Tax=Rosa rugosa TaxID=74645 RepID=UPI002B410C49|nr:nucleosome assembly protein 1;2-like isoform X1 [Rosa rugosa]XP_062009808.1 nucleosome assembly protein 1;2-like isoform X1 [Rosa rugosa]XP_062009809.1 nucleosome assembly protein 1;2-like isoform X1 [Rosa rugosa]XP_062009810.1 nucleosome assembly protein 1;2-like isoform X1 [Rosa rugosa]XP_062009811.1 nucleosome assembly protein 1;2-like isoform X1 [Rosa rugosa]XP_062009812.1 nucleosome assembly protein 1;2-like isoform X1 [Rosa rugosa]
MWNVTAKRSTIRDNFSFQMELEDRRLKHPVSYRAEKYRVLERDLLDRRAKLEANYQNCFRDLYRERFGIVNGVTEVGEPNTKGVPEFWLKAMKNNEVLAEEITECDEGALKYLQDIQWRRLVTRWRGGFELEFIFAHNPYFEDPSLIKQFRHEQTFSSEINWRHDQSLTHKLIEKPGKKGKHIVKTVKAFLTSSAVVRILKPLRRILIVKILFRDLEPRSNMIFTLVK